VDQSDLETSSKGEVEWEVLGINWETDKVNWILELAEGQEGAELRRIKNWLIGTEDSRRFEIGKLLDEWANKGEWDGEKWIHQPKGMPEHPLKSLVLGRMAKLLWKPRLQGKSFRAINNWIAVVATGEEIDQLKAELGVGLEELGLTVEVKSRWVRTTRNVVTDQEENNLVIQAEGNKIVIHRNPEETELKKMKLKEQSRKAHWASTKIWKERVKVVRKALKEKYRDLILNLGWNSKEWAKVMYTIRTKGEIWLGIYLNYEERVQADLEPENWKLRWMGRRAKSMGKAQIKALLHDYGKYWKRRRELPELRYLEGAKSKLDLIRSWKIPEKTKESPKLVNLLLKKRTQRIVGLKLRFEKARNWLLKRDLRIERKESEWRNLWEEGKSEHPNANGSENNLVEIEKMLDGILWQVGWKVTNSGGNKLGFVRKLGPIV